MSLPEGDFNQKQYKDNYQKYLDSNIDGKIGGTTISQRVQLFERFVPTGRRVLEIGSGGGDEALALKNAGYEIIASDYVDEFVTLLKQNGLEALQIDAKKDPLPPNLDAIYANAVFVHFSPEDILNFLQKAKDSLINERAIFLSIIKGEGYARDERNRGIIRDFYYYSLDSLGKIVEEADYRFLYKNDDDPKWIQAVISTK